MLGRLVFGDAMDAIGGGEPYKSYHEFKNLSCMLRVLLVLETSA